MLPSIVLSSLFISAVSFVGAFMLLSQKVIKKYTTSLVSFAAGVMLSASLLDLLPEALEAAEEGDIFTYVLIGVVLFFFLERFVLWFHHHHEHHGENPSTVLVLFGDTIHNLIDGVAIAAAFLTDPMLGFVTTLAIAAHEIPQEIADLGVLIAGGMKRGKALLFNFFSGLTAVVGAIFAYFYLEPIESEIWKVLAFAAGMFLYIACSDLIPELHKEFRSHKRWTQSAPFLIGIALMWSMIRVLEG